MKNLTKIFAVMMVSLFAFSCVTDSTEDLGVDAGKGLTTFTVSLEETKTQLGEKNADGKYPLYWSEGDQIAINGVASLPLSATYEGAASATFQVEDQSLTAPYCVVYPATEGVGEGTTYPVNFLAEQPYTEGTFASGAAPLYGYVAEKGTIQLNHLTGVLRLAVVGNGEALTSVVFKSETGKISGPFTVNCTNGTLTAQEGSSNEVTVTFAEPLVLGAEATPIYAAVPAGSYGGFSITLHTATDKMTVKFNSSVKPIALGAVREFTEFTYAANDVESGGTLFEIDGKDALIEFANMVSTGTFAPYSAAQVVANIDMTGVEWTPIEGFDGYTFDGGSTSGYAINGLTAPLFGSTNSTISNVKLTNVNIASNGRFVLGAVACKLVAGDTQSLISNCYVSGSITVNNPNNALADGANTYYAVNIGGIVGYIAGGAVSDCVNEANITISQIASNDNTTDAHPAVGGIVGAASVTGDILSPITNCVNGNKAGTTGAIKYLDNRADQLFIPQIGGILGLSSASNTTDIKNNTNYGAIQFNANAGGSGAISYDSTCIGGIMGYTRGNVEYNNNYGPISILGGNIKAFYLGGVCGVGITASFANNHNHNSNGILVDTPVKFYSLNVAGVVGGINGGGGTLDNCTNDAPIVSKASTATDITPGGWYYRVSGVVTYLNVGVSNCENKANGDITVSGDVIIARNNAQPGVAITGVSAYHTTDGTIVNLTNRGDININTNMSLHSGITSWEHGKVCIAGVNGYTTRSLRDLQNFGNITIGNTSSQISIVCNGLHIGGLVSHVSGALSVTNLDKNINKGNITVNKASLNGHSITTDSSVYACIGGLAGYYTGKSFQNSENEGDITLANYVAVGNVYLFLGGNIGYTTNAELVVKNTKNIGTITVSDNITKAFYFYAGGLVGYTSKAITFDNCHNAMKAGVENGVVIKGTWADATGSNTVRFGGIVGYPSSGVLTLKNGVTNSANFHITSKYRDSGGFSVGGIAGVCSNSAHKFTGLVQNSGNIYYAGECPKGTFCLAGCFGQFGTSASKSIEKLVNTGNITAVKTVANSFPTSSSKNGWIGGVVGSCSGNLPNAQSVCTITAINMEDTHGEAANGVGAIIGAKSPTILTNCHAGGKIITASETIDNGEDANGETSTTIVETPGVLNVSNYAAWLSGDHTFTSATAKSQKCGYISAIDATPQYAN